MTIICDKCGCENHMDEAACTECGHPIDGEMAYVVCSICGLSNPITAKKCIGCSEVLTDKKTFVLDQNKDEKDQPILSEESSVVFKPKENKIKNTKLPKHWRRMVLAGLAILSLVALLVFSIGKLLGDKNYISPSDGFYYINTANELHLVDEDQEDHLVMTGVAQVSSFVSYGSQYYLLADGDLFAFDGKLIKIAKDVNSFKVDLTGKRVLFTVDKDLEQMGDLYLYSEGNTLRLDANVGLNRYTFGVKSDVVYYVSEITAEENLGILYKIQGDGIAEKIADDVYEPVFSLRKDSVYFTRTPLASGEKFELYYAHDDRITEIGRNLVSILLMPKSEDLILVQEKNDVYNLFSSKREDVVGIESDIKLLGLQEFGDLSRPIVYQDRVGLVYQKVSGDNYYLDKNKVQDIGVDFEHFWLSESHDVIVVLSGNELLVGEFKKGVISDTISRATNGQLKALSRSGEALVIQVDDAYVVNRKGKEIPLEASGDRFVFSDDDNYLVYYNALDAYAYKLTANAPVYLGEDIGDFLVLDKYVYTFTEDQMFRYRLGKFSSQTELDTIKRWSLVDPPY